MNNYKKNLETLARYYPEMDILIKNAQKELKEQIKVEEETANDGEQILKVIKDGRTCYLNGKRDTKEAAHVWYQTLGELAPNAPVFILGVGNEYYLKELAEQTKNRITIIVYEPSLEIFLHFLKKVDLERWMEKHLIVFWVKGLAGMDADNMYSIISGVLTYEMMPYSRNLILPNYDVLFTKEAVEYMHLCRKIAMMERIGFNTKNLFSNVLVKNLIHNATYLCKGYKTIQLVDVIPRDIPGIVVAAGPSLNKNIQVLKKAKGKAFIIAVDTAIKPLLKAGIIPDMFAIIDAIKPVELVQMEEAKNIPLVTTMSASSDVLKYHQGMKFFFDEGYQFSERILLRELKQVATLSAGGSVATSAFALLYKIGIDTIILVGQDLAYTDNKSHADGTFHEIMEEQDTSNYIKVEGNYEEKVPTDGVMRSYIEWYDMMIEGYTSQRKKFHVINATEGGAKIKNTEIMTLQDAINRECIKEVDIGECLRKLPPMLSKENQQWAYEYLKAMPDEFQALLGEVKSLKKLYQKLDKIASRRNIDAKEYLSILKKIKRMVHRIDNLSAYQLVTMTLNEARYILKNEQFLSENTLQKEGKEIARKGILYMDNVEQCALVFKEFTEEAYKDFVI